MASSTAPLGIANFGQEFIDGGGWRIVLAAFIGMVFGLSALPFYTLGTLAKPIGADMGWSRGVVQTGLIFSMFGNLAGAWAAGWFIDRFGARRVILVSQVGLAAGLLLLSCQTGAPAFWYASWFFMAVMGIGTTPLSWSRGIAGWFLAGRGRALGVALAGTGVTAFLAPPIMTAFVAAHGWRAGYVALALSVLLVALPSTWMLFREKGARPGSASAQAPPPEPGLTAGETMRGYRFWVIILAFIAISFGIGGVIPSITPMLTDQGISAARAAGYASLIGVGIIAGRLVTGLLLDRFWAPAVALGLFLLPALACVFLVSHILLAPAVIMIGLGSGAEFDIIAYLCTRYFGMRNYGQIYGWQWASFAVAAGAGAGVFGSVYDRLGSYIPVLGACAALFVIGPLLLLLLGRYPIFEAQGPERRPTGD